LAAADLRRGVLSNTVAGMHRIERFEKVFCVGLTLTLLACLLAPAQPAQARLLTGHRPAVVPNLHALDRLDGGTRLELYINLPLHNREALTNLMEQLYDPANPLYHHYLAPDEFDARFGPTEDDYQAVLQWTAASGFDVTARHPNRMLLQVSGAVRDIERALGVTMRRYSHPTEPRTFYAPDAEPSVPSGLPILWVGGLDDFQRPHPKNLHRSPLRASTKATPKMGSGPNGTLGGPDYRAAYVPGTTLTGAGQVVGLMEFDGYYASDITSYESQMGLPNVVLQKTLLDGFNGIPITGANAANSEVAMDIELAISMAPGLSKVVVFEGLYFNTVLQAMSTNTAIKQFSCSWSTGTITTPVRTAMDGYFQKMIAQGQSFFDASGDVGAISGALDAPDDDPYITLVGGTTLATAGPSGAWLSEAVWNAQEGLGGYASGGGVSTIYSIPPWQQGVSMSANKGSTTKRNTPDVAMVADNIFIVADNGQPEITGGTSASAPLWAGFAALANQQAAAASLPAIGFVNPAIYQIGTNAAYAACFDDIRMGNNTNGNPAQYVATPGYDLCTGWGSPSGGSLIIALTQPDGFQITPGRGPVANGPAGGPFTVTAQTFSLTNFGKTAFNWTLGSTSAWLNVSSRNGTLSPGGGVASISASLNPAIAQLAPGVYTANLGFTNLTSGLVQVRQFTVQLGQDLVQDGGFETGDFAYWTLTGDVSAYTNNYVDDGTATGYSPFSGLYFGALGQASSLAYLSQTLPTWPGQRYLLSLWLMNPSGYTPSEFLVQWNTNSASVNTLFDQQNVTILVWTNLQFVVRAATTNTTLRFGFQNDSDFICLDGVSVLPVPTPVIGAAVQAGGSIQIDWTALAGMQYQPQYKTNLTQTSWLNLGGAVTATTNSASVSDLLGSGPRRFYRVMVLP